MKKLLYVVIALGLIAGGYYLYTQKTPVEDEPAVKTYSSETYSISFSYPARYYLDERRAEGSAMREHHIITLMDDTEENRAVRLPAQAGEGEAPGREGPIAITIDIYQNNLDGLTAEGWMKNSSASNFKLGSGEFEEAEVAGLAGVSYEWDGLYRGKTVAVADENYIYAFSATYLEPGDFTLVDLPNILDTVELK